MFYMPHTKMLFGDAKTTCDGKFVVLSRIAIQIIPLPILSLSLSFPLPSNLPLDFITI